MFSLGLAAALPILCLLWYFGVLSKRSFASAFAAYGSAIICLVCFSNAAASMFFAGLLYFAVRLFFTVGQSSVKKQAKAIAVSDFENGKGRIMLDGQVYYAVSSAKDSIKSGEVLLASAVYGNAFAVMRKNR